MRVNRVKEKLSRGEVVLGGNINYYCPAMVEFIGALGFDWALVDCERGRMSETEAGDMVRRATEASGVDAFLRVPISKPSLTIRLLDLGAMGIMVPQVDTREEAEAAVRIAKYYPTPEGADTGNVRIQYETSERNTMVIARIQSVEGVENVEEIASVPGLDAVALGPYGLAQSIGTQDWQVIDEALDRVVEATIQAGKISAVSHIPPTDIERLHHFCEKGVRLLGVTIDNFLRIGATQWLQQVRRMGW